MKRFLLCILFPVLVTGQELSVFKTVGKDSITLNLANHLYGPTEITVQPVEELADRIVIVKPNFVLQARDSSRVASIPLHLIPNKDSMRWDHFFSLKAILGDPENAKHNTDYRYALPYPKGKKYKIVQGFNGNFTHNTVKSRYAIDFDLRIGDTICAAREGVVVRTKDHFKEHGGKEFISKANLITILHDDGTLAAYVHLDYKGVLVKPGDYVEKGQPIGISGLTGFTRGPHLHFVVREARDVSVPIYFEGYEKKIIKKGKKYVRKK
ncbi:M23 family metallopeptidase [Ascidiimonas aurantiaca]|uniref:M23 family metallopeptidase n=1 Tax=Ascidiimonas aurantiaca TaxID=1685432 RepID=UPI0030EB36F3